MRALFFNQSDMPEEACIYRPVQIKRTKLDKTGIKLYIIASSNNKTSLNF